MAVNTLASNFSADVSTYIAAKLLILAEKTMALYQICDKVAMPKGEGRTFQYTRYERVALPQSTLAEGVTPGDTAMAISTVTAVMDQWGAVIPLSDVAIDSVKHPVLQKAVNLAGLQAAETLDREIYMVMMGGTSVYFPNAISARGSLTTSDKMSSTLIDKIYTNLRNDGAMFHEGRFYVGVADPFVASDIRGDSLFTDAAKYGMIKKLMNNEIGEWKGVRWIESNTLPTLKLGTAGSAASSATAGTLANSTAYDFKLVVVDAKTGHETFIGAVIGATTGASEESIDITVPALPAGATAGSKYRLYSGADGGTLYLHASDINPSSTYNVPAIATSGDVAPVTPPSGVPVHTTFVVGKEAIACIELNKVKSYLTEAKPSDSDPLVQRRKVGWKCDFKAVITNEDFLARAETYATNNP